jgi:hypothetical protein
LGTRSLHPGSTYRVRAGRSDSWPCLRSKAGQRLEEIGRALKTDTGVLKKPIADLLKEKKLRTTGAKRGTRYFTR